MAVVTPNPEHIRPFASAAAFETWLSKQHDKAPEVWLKIFKKAAGVPTVTYLEAVDVALCWGWIDGIKKSLDSEAFLQRFTPRKGNSRWSQINVEKVEQLTKAGRMTPHGQKHVDAAQADGRWKAAYPAPSKLAVPADLLAAIENNRKALVTFRSLNRANLYALAYRLHHTKPNKRSERIEHLTHLLARGETLHPNTATKPAKTTPPASTPPASTPPATTPPATTPPRSLPLEIAPPKKQPPRSARRSLIRQPALSCAATLRASALLHAGARVRSLRARLASQRTHSAAPPRYFTAF